VRPRRPQPIRGGPRADNSGLSHRERPMATATRAAKQNREPSVATGRTGQVEKAPKNGIVLPENLGIRLAPPPVSGGGLPARASDVEAILSVLRRADRTFVRNIRGIVSAVAKQYPYVLVHNRAPRERVKEARRSAAGTRPPRNEDLGRVVRILARGPAELSRVMCDALENGPARFLARAVRGGEKEGDIK
jgi:hypothetical protein